MIKKIITLFLINFTFLFAQEIVFLKGEIYLNDSKISQKTKLTLGDIVESKNKDSFVVIKYKDASKILLKNGTIKILNIKKNKRIISLESGSLFTHINPQSKQGFSIKSKQAVFGVRGTKFWLQTNHDESYLCVCEGKVVVENQFDKKIISKNFDLKVDNQKKKFSLNEASKDMMKMAVDGLEILEKY